MDRSPAAARRLGKLSPQPCFGEAPDWKLPWEPVNLTRNARRVHNGEPMHEVTRLLSAFEQCGPAAVEPMLPLVCDAFRKLAAQMLAQAAPGRTLEATTLAHEAYLRLVSAGQPKDGLGRGPSFAAAAHAMPNILVESTRCKRRTKARGRAAESANELGKMPTVTEVSKARSGHLTGGDSSSCSFVVYSVHRRSSAATPPAGGVVAWQSGRGTAGCAASRAGGGLVGWVLLGQAHDDLPFLAAVPRSQQAFLDSPTPAFGDRRAPQTHLAVPAPGCTAPPWTREGKALWAVSFEAVSEEGLAAQFRRQVSSGEQLQEPGGLERRVKVRRERRCISYSFRDQYTLILLVSPKRRSTHISLSLP